MRILFSLIILLGTFLLLSFTHHTETTKNLLAGVLHPTRAYAGTISGQVSIAGGYTSFGDPNVTVTLTNENTGNSTSANTDSNGKYSLSGSGTSDISIRYNTTSYFPTTSTFLTINAGSSQTVNFSISPIFTLSGKVTNTATGQGIPNVSVKTDGQYVVSSQTATTDSTGTYAIKFYPVCFSNGTLLCNYGTGNLQPICPTQVTMTVPSGWSAGGATTQTITYAVGKCLGGATGPNFSLTATPTPPPTFSISGNVFADANKNGLIDGGESDYAAAPSISSNPNSGTITKNANGTYSVSGISAGTYTISYSGPPSGYLMTYPLSNPPPSFQVTVGSSGCSVNGALGASCTAGNITNLNFGITNLHPWFQSNCGDIRDDNGIVDTIPSSQYLIKTVSPCTSAGVAFTGNINVNLDSGQVSSSNQIVGGATYPEVYPSSYSPVSTSYPILLLKASNANLAPIDITGNPVNCNLGNCTLPSNIPHGIYIANNSLTLNAWTVPANQNYVFLINGNLTLNGPITVPVGSTVLFSTKGNITVASTVGTATLSSSTPNLSGWYIAGGSFVLPTAGNCTDLRLNIAGSVVVNALGTGGTLQNSRDLCGSDPSDPTITFIQRLDFLLHAPEFLGQQKVLTRETNP
ncbi:MAG TPA: hypothetical protein VLF93_00680 [Candidatus Saccharimonadales bacterium]|nr:hypothetical protein [Candidatus Saccharimonadales bacterium]